jgi:hypothetical protein
MAAQYLNSWNPLAIIDAHKALATLLGTGCKLIIKDATDNELATIMLNPITPAQVNTDTGELQLTQLTREESANAGLASYGSLVTSGNVVYRSLTAQQGTAPVAGKCVLSSTTIIANSPVELVSFSIQ